MCCSYCGMWIQFLWATTRNSMETVCSPWRQTQASTRLVALTPPWPFRFGVRCVSIKFSAPWWNCGRLIWNPSLWDFPIVSLHYHLCHLFSFASIKTPSHTHSPTREDYKIHVIFSKACNFLHPKTKQKKQTNKTWLKQLFLGKPAQPASIMTLIPQSHQLPVNFRLWNSWGCPDGRMPSCSHQHPVVNILDLCWM